MRDIICEVISYLLEADDMYEIGANDKINQ